MLEILEDVKGASLLVPSRTTGVDGVGQTPIVHVASHCSARELIELPHKQRLKNHSCLHVPYSYMVAWSLDTV